MANIDTLIIPEHLAARQSAKRRDRVIQIVMVLLAVVCMVGAGLVLPRINAQRSEFQLTVNPEEIKGLPPDIALMTKTGTLRLLAINMAFSRMERLKEEGKFYELKQLSDYVCKLAPLYPGVWVYASWNQAYNISVSEYDPDARWRWVNNGLKLLRDKGIPYNPKSILLYKELSWIYWHKIADFADDAHWVYKAHLAFDMERVLGAPKAITVEEQIHSIRDIAVASPDPADLIQADLEVADLVGRMARVDLRPSTSLLDFVFRHMRDEIQIQDLLASAQPTDEKDQLRNERLALLTDPKVADALGRLLASVRHHVLRTDLRLDPNWMVKLMEDYGPLDWRSPYAHSLYWATKGDMETKGQLNLDPSDSMNTVRFIFFAVQNSIERGKLSLIPNFDDPGKSFVEFSEDLRFIPYLFDAYMVLGEEQYKDSPNYRPGTPGPNYWAGFVNWLRESIHRLYWAGGEDNLALAEDYLDYLRRMHKADDGSIRAEYLLSLEDFCKVGLKDILVSFKGTQSMISNFLARSIRERALGRIDLSESYLAKAQEVWNIYMKDNEGERNVLQPLFVMRREAIVNFMKSPAVPMIYKSRLWRWLINNDGKMAQMCYDEAVPFVLKLCEMHDPPLDVTKVMAEPAGMEAYRENPIIGREHVDESVEQGEKKFEAP